MYDELRGYKCRERWNKFSITDVKGARPKFNGVKVKYSPQAAASLGAYTVLAPGTSIDVTHDSYNFTSSGSGVYDFEPDNIFYIVKEDGKVASLYANEAQVHTASVTGNLAVARKDDSAFTKRATFVNCSSTRQTQITAAAQSYASESLSSSLGILVLRSRLLLHASTAGIDSKAGTIIYQSSHFTANGGTDDFAYGQTAAKALTVSNPAHAILNADNHEYFSENNPSLS
ncbi:lysine-specific metallo-endopeptidase-domain-containing protein [Cyathus striatus]|nr:lysine-specific metallo-endopeptidase-domain-containing protein [Cyathus striatus]